MKRIPLVLVTFLLAGCGGNTLGALGVTEIGKEKGAIVYEAHSMTGRAWLDRNTPVYSGSAEFKAYKKRPADQQKLTDVEFRNAELMSQARQKCPSGFTTTKPAAPSRFQRSGAAQFFTSSMQFTCK